MKNKNFMGSCNVVFPLMSSPYVFQTRLMEILPYFMQIELAQTNHQFFKLYETRFIKRNLTKKVNVIFNNEFIQINNERYSYSFFKNEKSIKSFLQSNYFPTECLNIKITGELQDLYLKKISIKVTNFCERKKGTYFFFPLF